MNKLTEYFAPHTRPVHVGLYDVDLTGNGAYKGASYWDGIAWCNTWAWGTKNVGDKTHTSFGQNRYWRGLAENPKKKGK